MEKQMDFFLTFFLGKSAISRLGRFCVDALPSIPLAHSQTPDASLLLCCPRQTPCVHTPPLLRCSTRPAPRTLTETHTSRRSQLSESHLRMSDGKA